MDIVTGSFGYIGRYITRHLLDKRREVQTITTHPDKPNPFGAQVRAHSYSFDDPHKLTETLRGAETLYNTYWIRFEYDGQTYAQALENTELLFECARRAGVGRIVQIGVTQADEQSPLPYYRGKAVQERMAAECGVPYTILRTTLVYGKEDILVNNVAWLLRKFPVFPIFGDGKYRVQPIFVGDLAEIAVESASAPTGTRLDAIGPDTFTFEELVRQIAIALGRNPLKVHMPPALAISLGDLIGFFLDDVILTGNEALGLMASLLTSTQAPNGHTSFPDWLEGNKAALGAAYTSEVGRHFRWKPGR